MKKKYNRVEGHIGLFTTSICNYKCPYCINNCMFLKNSFIDVEKLDKFLARARKEGYYKLTCTGGESCLHPRFEELIEVIVKNDFKFSVISNGGLWERYKFLLKYKDHFLGMTFSIDGLEETHDKFRGEGAFGRVLEAIDFFGKEKTDINFTANRFNTKEFLELFRLLIPRVNKIKIHPTLRAEGYYLFQENMQELEEILGLEEQKNPELIKQLEYNIPYHNPSSVCSKCKLVECSEFLSRDLTIYPDGTINICCMLPSVGEKTTIEDSISKILKVKKRNGLKIIKKIYDYKFNNDYWDIKDYCSICFRVLGIE